MVFLSYIILFMGWLLSVFYYVKTVSKDYEELREEHSKAFSLLWCVLDGIFNIIVPVIAGIWGIEFVASKSMLLLSILNIISIGILILTLIIFSKFRKGNNQNSIS